jgi:hypothetical protein
MNIINLIESSRQYLYHGTSLNAIISILHDDVLKPTTKHVINGKPVYGISTTRNKRFAETWGEVVIVLDTERIGHHNKMVPVDFKHNNPHYNINYRDNSEDFIVGEIDNVKYKIKQIILTKKVRPEVAFEIESKMERLGIPVSKLD